MACWSMATARKRSKRSKRSKRHRMIAIKAVAHKIARACYHLLRDGMRFEVKRAFE